MTVYTLNLKAPSFQGTLKIELDPANSNEATILSHLQRGKLYENDISTFLINVLRQGDTVLDVGANIGFFSVLCSALVGSSGNVVSFEPDGENLKRLKHNLGLNEFNKTIIVGDPASNSIEEVDFFFNSDDTGGHALWDPALFPANMKSKTKRQAQKVKTVTLDSKVLEHELSEIKVIKIDTEGADQLVLEGASGLLKDCSVPFVITELHEFGLNKMGCSQQSLRELMEGFGYSTFALSYDGKLPKFIPPKTRVSSKYFVNLLFSTPDNISKYWPVEEIKPAM